MDDLPRRERNIGASNKCSSSLQPSRALAWCCNLVCTVTTTCMLCYLYVFTAFCVCTVSCRLRVDTDVREPFILLPTPLRSAECPTDRNSPQYMDVSFPMAVTTAMPSLSAALTWYFLECHSVIVRTSWIRCSACINVLIQLVRIGTVCLLLLKCVRRST